jgi:ABC-type molybdate transport system permease subunit
MKNNLLFKINRSDLKYVIASSILMILLIVVIGYALVFLVGKSSQIAGFPKRNITGDNTRFDTVKLEQFKRNFIPFGK